MNHIQNQFTVLTWNVNGFSLRDQPRLLASMEWDLACLQEMTRESWTAFQACGDDGAVAFDHLPTLASSGPRYACAVLVRSPARLVDFSIVPDVPSPERAAVAVVETDGKQLQLCAWAAPPGVSWGDAGKGRQVDRFASWLRDRPGPVVVGIDRNAPQWERHDLAEDEWWNRWEPLLYGPDRVHDLRDVYRDHLANNPDLAAHLRQTHPDGPLAVTHRRRGTDCRYDAIYASPEFQVDNVEHHLDAALDAGSDHAMVRATLSWRV